MAGTADDAEAKTRVYSRAPPSQISCVKKVSASPDGTQAVFGACPKLIQLERCFGPSGCLDRSTHDLKQTM